MLVLQRDHQAVVRRLIHQPMQRTDNRIETSRGFHRSPIREHPHNASPQSPRHRKSTFRNPRLILKPPGRPKNILLKSPVDIRPARQHALQQRRSDRHHLKPANRLANTANLVIGEINNVPPSHRPQLDAGHPTIPHSRERDVQLLRELIRNRTNAHCFIFRYRLPPTLRDIPPATHYDVVVRLLIATTLLSMSIALAQAPHFTPIANVGARKTISLDGKWQTIVDPYEVGFYDFHQHPGGAGFFRNQHASDKSELVEYDFDKSPQLDVPGDWNTQRPDLFFYEGTIWYKRSFDYRTKDNTRVFLYFGAVNYDAKVALNGEPLGEHVGGFTPFAFEVTGKLRDKDNFVVVKVDNKRLREGVPQVNTDWWNYGGITRSVSLIEVPETFVQDYFVQLKKGSPGTVAGWVKLDGTKLHQHGDREDSRSGHLAAGDHR
jgi:hypothetical protein